MNILWRIVDLDDRAHEEHPVLVPVVEVVLCVVGALIIGLLLAGSLNAGCERYDPVPPHEPTGIKGCELYGEGLASDWQGPGVARNDCVYPWTDCQPIYIYSLETGIGIVVTPTMYCDCYTGTSIERIVDLDPASLLALGLDSGLNPVRVDPMMLPNTAMQP